MNKIEFYKDIALVMNKHGVAGISGAIILAGEDLDIRYMNISNDKDTHAHVLGHNIAENVRQYVESCKGWTTEEINNY